VSGPLGAASLVGRPGAQPSGPVKGPSLGGEKARLQVQSFLPIPLNIGFHYVKLSINAPNTPAPLGVHTNRVQDATLETQIAAHINRIYGKQTNISFALVDSKIVHNNGVQSPHVDSTHARTDSQGRSDAERLPDQGGAGHLRVFFVGRIGSATGNEVGLTPVIGERFVLCQDALTEEDQGASVTTDARRIGQVLAHEFGHCFGEDDQKQGEDLLTFEHLRGGERIPIRVAERMRRDAAKIALARTF
jgi:hypothetical protein